jgi:eukaryotic-like serine/threonine-protein kinase
MMLTGEVPFGRVGPLDCWMKKIRNDFVPPRDLNPHISDRADWAIRRSMSGDAEQRPSSCREFIEDVTGVTIRGQSVLTDQPVKTDEAVKTADVWYLVYKDETGQTHTVKGTTEGIRRALKEQLLGDASNVRACRTKSGPFQPLKGYPEFRDLVVEPAPMPTAANASSGLHPTVGGKSTPVSSNLPTAASGLRPSLRPDPDAVDLNQPPSAGSKGRPALQRPQPKADENRPHIPMRKDDSTSLASVLLLILVAVLTAVLAILFLPKHM